ncbi:MAG TPA: amino acid ABC transporter permease [Jiangellaceae bacterium]
MRKRTRQRLIRGAMYVLLVAIVVFVAIFADWDNLQRQFFQPDIARELFPDVVLIAATNTIKFTAIAFVGGFTIGLFLALMRLSPVAPYRWLATIYIEVFRGIPALLTIFATTLVLPIALNVRIPGFAGMSSFAAAGVVGLIIVAAAYFAEVFRAGIQAVPKGQTEAARSLGMSPSRTMISIVLPQAIRTVIPPLTNEFVLLIKDTALIFLAVGGIAADQELTAFARDEIQQFGNATPLIVTAIMYLIITIPLTQLVAWMERRGQRSGASARPGALAKLRQLSKQGGLGAR